MFKIDFICHFCSSPFFKLCYILTHLLHIAACGLASSTDSQLNDDDDNEVAVITLSIMLVVMAIGLIIAIAIIILLMRTVKQLKSK